MKRFALWVCVVAAGRGVHGVGTGLVPLQDGKTLAGGSQRSVPNPGSSKTALSFHAATARTSSTWARSPNTASPGTSSSSRRDDLTRRQQRHLRAHEVAGPGLARGRYRAGHQFESARREDERVHRTQDDGSVYAVRNTWRAPVADNVWFNYRIGSSARPSDFHQRQTHLRIPEVPRRSGRRQEGAVAGFWHVRAAGARPGQHREIPQHESARPAQRRRASRRSRTHRRSRARQPHHAGIRREHPLIDLGLSAPDGIQPGLRRQARRYGVLPLRIQDLPQMAGSIFVIVDRDRGPDVEAQEPQGQGISRGVQLGGRHQF